MRSIRSFSAILCLATIVFTSCNVTTLDGVYFRLGGKVTTKSILESKDTKGLYPVIRFEKNGIATIYSLQEFATTYTLANDVVRIKTDTYDLILERKENDTLIGRGVAAGTYIKVKDQQQLDQLVQEAKQAEMKEQARPEKPSYTSMFPKKEMSLNKAKNLFLNFVADYMERYENQEPISFERMTAHGSLVSVDENEKTKKTITAKEFAAGFQKELYSHFAFIREEGGGSGEWEIKKQGDHFIISAHVNLMFYDFSFQVIDQEVKLEKLSVFTEA